MLTEKVHVVCCSVKRRRGLSVGSFRAGFKFKKSTVSDDFMCAIDDNKVKAGSLGLMEVIKAAMERHASSEEVSNSGLGALQNICENGSSV